MSWFTDAVDSGFFCYMAEAEGLDNLVSTREARINAVIKDARAQVRRNILSSVDLWDICSKHNLDSLTTNEMTRIEREVNR